MSLRLVQIAHPHHGRRVALVDGDDLRPLRGHGSTYALAQAAIGAGTGLADAALAARGGERLDYRAIWRGDDAWRLLPAFDHPDDPARVVVSGTGLTHRGSALARQAMHADAGDSETDSLRMFRWGAADGRPAAGAIGVAPEWFHKGRGEALRAHGEPLDAPAFAESASEEAEVAGLYLVDPAGRPRRIGFALADEFSDHALERRSYLWLATSKLRPLGLGPELVADPAAFAGAAGTVRVERDGRTIWQRGWTTGEAHMTHTLANLEHHHFKHAGHRRPGDAHVHCFGADAFSSADGIALADGDRVAIELAGFGRPLVNPVRFVPARAALAAAQPL